MPARCSLEASVARTVVAVSLFDGFDDVSGEMADPSRSANQAVQLRLSFAATPPPQRIFASLAGMTVLLGSDRSDSELFTYLSSAGLTPEFRAGVGVSIPASQLLALAALPVAVAAGEDLRSVWTLVTNPPPPSFPATLENVGASFLLSWEDRDSVNYDEYVDPSAVAALVVAEVPFVATDEVWARIESMTPALRVVGRAEVHRDGFIAISTSRPQLIETSALPGLFRVDATTFGVAAAYADHVSMQNGIRWTSPPPRRSRPALNLPAHLQLSPHLLEDLPALVADLDSTGSKALVWETGLGRRVLALAALEVLDAFPATVLTTPSGLWAWYRHVDLLGRSCSLGSDEHDVSLITYRDLAHRRIEPQALIFDELFSDEARASRPLLRALSHLRDCVRLAIDDDWPSDPDDLVEAFEIIRPAEFRSDVPLAQRYPLDPKRRVYEHVEAFTARRTQVDLPPAPDFKRSTVRTVALSESQVLAMAQLADRAGVLDPEVLLAELVDLVAAGPSQSVGPKVVAAVQAVRSAQARSASVAVVTRSKRAAQLIRSMLRPLTCSFVEAVNALTPVPKVPVAVVRFDHFPPDLQAFDEVVVVDYPWSLAALDAAVGSASTPAGPDVTVLHSPGSIDDRLALFAARRTELAAVSNAAGPPNAHEIAYLLAPRT
jgi:hypothetical protein